MPATILDPLVRSALRERLLSLRADSPARWGSMDAPRMLCHVGDAMSQAIGELELADQSTLLFRTLVRWVVIRGPRLPKGAPTSPRIVAGTGGTVPAEFAADLARVLDLLDRNAAWPPERPMPPHPAFGPLSHAERGILTWKHLDHHLRQFGA